MPSVPPIDLVPRVSSLGIRWIFIFVGLTASISGSCLYVLVADNALGSFVRAHIFRGRTAPALPIVSLRQIILHCRAKENRQGGQAAAPAQSSTGLQVRFIVNGKIPAGFRRSHNALGQKKFWAVIISVICGNRPITPLVSSARGTSSINAWCGRYPDC